MYKANLLFFLAVFSAQFTFSQCTHCSSLEEALINPEKVVSLDMSAQGLVKVPIELNSFINLKSLDLSENLINELDFTGVFLPELLELNLSFNPGINAMVVVNMNKALPNLGSLNLSNNSIRYLSPNLALLSSLEHINLSNNAISHVPDEIGEMSSLVSVDVSDNLLADVFWLKEMWNLEELNIAGNEDLDLELLGFALMAKSSLVKVEFTPNSTKAVPSSFERLPIKELILSDALIHSMNFRVCRNDSVKKVVFDNCEFSNGRKIYGWLNRFKSLETVEFDGMEIPANIHTVKGVAELSFKTCEFASIADLREVSPQIRIASIDSDITNGDFTGNSRRVKNYYIQNAQLDSAMTDNTLNPIVQPRVQEIHIKADEQRMIDLDFSSYNIPSEAFLTQDGQIYAGDVKLKITEYKNPIVNALSGVPMTYREDGVNQLFASSGMIDFRAYDEGGNELNPNPNNVIQVELNDIQPSEGTDLYSYNPEVNNWEVIGKPTPTNYDSIKKHYMDSLNLLPDSLFINFRIIPIKTFLKYENKRKSQATITFSFNGSGHFDKDWWKKSTSMVYTENNAGRWICGGKTWIIDTIITPEIDTLLRYISEEEGENYNFFKVNLSNGIYEMFPSRITELRIDPNIEHDNYTLSFKYKGQAIQLPVYLSMGGATARIQKKEQRNYEAYRKLRIIEDKIEKQIILRKSKIMDELAEIGRRQTIQFLMARPGYEQEQRERLRFGLDNFGLVNCDYFSREKPNDYIAFADVAIDQHGERIHVPDNIRNIMLKTNSYVSTSSQSVPVYSGTDSRSVMLFTVGEDQVAVVKDWKVLPTGKVQPNVIRFSTEGMTGDRVASKILRL
ncbi:MAG: leucine-rich repeat domain-containing protein [Crocinitomicaceae bacterium]|nr:leucine-rich repeat domain-containing protein [Crocinitomicaceae bacterium]